MFNFVCKTSYYVRCAVRTSPTQKLNFLQRRPLTSSPALESISNASEQHPFTVSYLINSCGFPLEKALSASRYVSFQTPDQPDSVLSFFKNHGFTQTQISNLTRRFPPILLTDIQKTLLPKFEFFHSKGVSSSDIAKILSVRPHILRSSLKNHLIPSFDSLKNLLQSNEDAIYAIKRSPLLLSYDRRTCVAHNIEILRESGVPERNLSFLLKYHPLGLQVNTDRFKEVVEDIKKLGFDPSKVNFVAAVTAMRQMTKLTWHKKMEVYKKWGLSADEVLVAFQKHPGCMTASEDKIMVAMDFFVNKLGLESSFVMKRPKLISVSFKRVIVPRYSVYQVLLSKGLIKEDFSLVVSMWNACQKSFLERFVNHYEVDASELLKVYQETLDISK